VVYVTFVENQSAASPAMQLPIVGKQREMTVQNQEQEGELDSIDASQVIAALIQE
jgi:hypothetical protein